MEHHEDGSPNPDGKKLRKKAKQIMLGVMYGMGAKLMSINLGVSMDECKEILNEFAKMFPKIKEFTEYNEQCAKEKGYVEDYLGRRRHLPDAFLTELEIMPKRQVLTDADVIFDMNSSDRCIEIPDEEAWKMWNQKWAEFSQSRRFNAKKEFKETLKSNNVEYQDNGAFISKTMTQCTNARVQGSAASLTKKAMVAIHNDPLMRKYGFRLLIPVHDELLGECKMFYAREAQKRLSELMIQAGLPECSVKMKCDAYCVKHWYADEVSDQIHDTYVQYLSKGMSSEDAVSKLCDTYKELQPNSIRKMCNEEFDVLSDLL